MSYFHETIWKGVPKFLRRVDTALKNIGINERVPYNAPLIQFSSWMGGDRDGTYLFSQEISECAHYFLHYPDDDHQIINLKVQLYKYGVVYFIHYLN